VAELQAARFELREAARFLASDFFRRDGLLERDVRRIRPSAKDRRFLNDLLQEFLAFLMRRSRVSWWLCVRERTEAACWRG
jgi:hypothetical protein